WIASKHIGFPARCPPPTLHFIRNSWSYRHGASHPSATLDRRAVTGPRSRARDTPLQPRRHRRRDQAVRLPGPLRFQADRIGDVSDAPAFGHRDADAAAVGNDAL